MAEKTADSEMRTASFLGAIGYGLVTAMPGLPHADLWEPRGKEVPQRYRILFWAVQFIATIVLFALAICALAFPVSRLYSEFNLGFVLIAGGAAIAALSSPVLWLYRVFERPSKNPKKKVLTFAIFGAVAGIVISLLIGLIASNSMSSLFDTEASSAQYYGGMIAVGVICGLSTGLPYFNGGLALVILGIYPGFLEIFTTVMLGESVSTYLPGIAVLAIVFAVVSIPVQTFSSRFRKKDYRVDSVLRGFGIGFSVCAIILFLVRDLGPGIEDFKLIEDDEEWLAAIWMIVGLAILGIVIGIAPFIIRLYSKEEGVIRVSEDLIESRYKPLEGEVLNPVFDSRIQASYGSAEPVSTPASVPRRTERAEKPVVKTTSAPSSSATSSAELTSALSSALRGEKVSIPVEKDEKTSDESTVENKDEKESRSSRETSKDDQVSSLEDILGGH